MADNTTEFQSQIPNRSVIHVSLDHDVTSNDHEVQGTIKSKEVNKGLIIVLYFNYMKDYLMVIVILCLSLSFSLSPFRTVKEMLLLKLALKLLVGFKN